MTWHFLCIIFFSVSICDWSDSRVLTSIIRAMNNSSDNVCIKIVQLYSNFCFIWFTRRFKTSNVNYLCIYGLFCFGTNAAYDLNRNSTSLNCNPLSTFKKVGFQIGFVWYIFWKHIHTMYNIFTLTLSIFIFIRHFIKL